jgi:TolB protein
MRITTGTFVLCAACLMAAGALLGGCGGGGASGGTSAARDQEMYVGGMVTRVAGTTQAPLTLSGQGAVVTGVAGGTVSSLSLAAPAATPGNSAAILALTRIAFDRAGEVYQIGENGTAPGALTTSVPTYYNPTAPEWSPDGAKIAFMRYDPTINHFQIYTMAANGGGVTRISNGTGDDQFPSWSPDGAKIVFQRSDTVAGHIQIWVMTAGGGSPHTVDDGTTDDFQPSYSPDGAKILFTRYDTALHHRQIYTMAAAGGSPHNVLSWLTSYDLSSPTWSPDGTKIAFSFQNGSNYHIYVVRADGMGNWQALTSATMNDFNPSWSPDGTRVAFERTDTSVSHSQIYVVNADSTGVRRISDGQTDDRTPAWSPYVKARKFVGAGGVLGTTASGFLVGQQGKAVTSLVVFNAATPNAAHLDAQDATAPYTPNLVFTVSGDLLNALVYVNGVSGPPTTVLSAGATATGAVVSFDAIDGTVTGVFPYTANRAAAHDRPAPARSGDTLVYRASFLGVWDGSGRNRSPGGATEVQIDGRTGRLLSFR